MVEIICMEEKIFSLTVSDTGIHGQLACCFGAYSATTHHGKKRVIGKTDHLRLAGKCTRVVKLTKVVGLSRGD